MLCFLINKNTLHFYKLLLLQYSENIEIVKFLKVFQR